MKFKDKTKRKIFIDISCLFSVCMLLFFVSFLYSCQENKNMDFVKNKFQSASKVFMVYPKNFEYNEQTKSSNAFQEKSDTQSNEIALQESKNLIQLLRDNGIEVITQEDNDEVKTPDSIFPNNWFSTHDDGTFVLYPMYAENRRAEKKDIFINTIKSNIKKGKTIDLSWWENSGQFLEGTGSMVLDRLNKIAYSCKSPRTSEAVLDDFCSQLGYSKIVFEALDKNDTQIYHTNVMMSIATNFAVVCSDSIKNKEEKQKIFDSLTKTDKEIIEINYEQMQNFAGNMLEVRNKSNEKFIVMSDTAYNSLTKNQIEAIEQYCKIIHTDINYIEKNGGGSVRCMMGELF